MESDLEEHGDIEVQQWEMSDSTHTQTLTHTYMYTHKHTNTLHNTTPQHTPWWNVDWLPPAPLAIRGTVITQLFVVE